MRIVCPHCSHPIEVSQSGTPRDGPDPELGSTVPEGPRVARSRANPHQRLGKLALMDRVGAGSFGEVWKAHDTELNRLVAGSAGWAHLDQVRAVGADDAHGRSPRVRIGTMLPLSPAGARRST